jgi:hypothetical protein
MNTPGFTAEASLNATSGQYHATSSMNRISGTGGGITLAGTCTCTDPQCTWTCPSPDPCAHCRSLPTACARARCFCICNDGIPIPSIHAPCGFVCT